MEYILLEALSLLESSEKCHLIEFKEGYFWVPKKIIYGGFTYKDTDVCVRKWWVDINKLEGTLFLARETSTY